MTTRALETGPATSLDRRVVQPLSGQTPHAACEASFGAAAGSAPLFQALGFGPLARIDGRAAACAPSRPPAPNDWIGWPGSGFSVRRSDGAISVVQGSEAESAVDGE